MGIYTNTMNNIYTKILDMERHSDELMELLETGAKIPLVVTGSSMEPFLKHEKDTVWLIRPEKYRKGQILFFRRSNGSMVLHRIRKICPDGRMVVNGDAQTWCETVRQEQAAAVVVAVTRNGITRKADCLIWKIRDFLWYPTRPIRPALLRLYAVCRYGLR